MSLKHFASLISVKLAYPRKAQASFYSLLYQAEEEEEQYTLPGGTVTTAEPRPNAYIPEDDAELPIPRPYGSHAPFKPAEPGSTMRHIRKPIPKPIEI